MKCLILGGAGFIGSHLAEELRAEGHEVRIFDRPNLALPAELLADSRIEWHEGDFLNVDDLARVVPGSDVIFHLVSATLPKSSNDNPAYDVETNVIGTLRLLDLARTNGVKRIVFASSGGTVYGLPHTLPINESHATEPLVSYGITKLAIEKFLHMYRALHGLDYCILRLANPFGERQRVGAAQGAVAVFLHRAWHGETIHIWGDGSVVRDYIYIKDAVRAFVKALSYQGEQRVFNIGSGQGLSLNQVLAGIEALLGRPVAVNYEHGRKFDVPVNVLDITRARDLLGWQPSVNFDDGLALTLAGLRRSGDQ
ncbi:MAG: NAD-dependent epimerase/dehydratase family protein [Sterolibacterium sp.]|jgi:UDP-glucose 4-epimerase